MVSLGRWQRAQQYERGYWEQRARDIAAGANDQLGWYKWRADQLLERLKAQQLQRLIDGSAAVIEVGSGPIGVAGFFPASERVLVDPLQDFYGTNEVLTSLRNPEARYLKGTGEALPADSSHYDLAIIENCIDHVQDMDGVMRELVRVLKPGATLYLTVNCRTPVGFVVHRTLSRLRLDPGHPHTFTPPRVQRMLQRYGFAVIDLKVGSYQKAKSQDLASPSRKARLKARLGISEFLASVIARRSS